MTWCYWLRKSIFWVFDRAKLSLCPVPSVFFLESCVSKVGHNLPFKYGRYGTETANTVVIGDAESVGTQVYQLLLLYTLFVTTLSFIPFRQGRSQPSRTRLHGLSDPMLHGMLSVTKWSFFVLQTNLLAHYYTCSLVPERRSFYVMGYHLN
jgi:hypothetical protein